MSENKKRFLVSTLIVAAASLLSRLLGLLRSTLLASYYGATQSDGLSDCYQASFILPDIIYNIVVLGAISIILVPYFSSIITGNDKTELDEKSSGILNFFFILIALFALIAFVFAPFIVRNFLVKGWDNDSLIDTTIKLTRIMLLQPIFMSMSGILAAYLNSKERYTAYSFAMLSYNVGIIIGIVALSIPFGIYGVAWGTVLGSIAQFLIQLTGAKLSGFTYKLKFPVLNKEFFLLLLTAVPRIIALGGEQLVKLFLTNQASFIFTGSIIIFSYAENISMVPFGMIAVSLSTTAFPIFSKKFAAFEYDEMLHSLMDKIRMLLFFIMPITVFVVILRYEIIDILLGYKRFGSEDIKITGNALYAYSIGIPFYSITILVVKYFYAQKKTLSPMFISLFMCIVTIISSQFMVKSFSSEDGVTALSAARTLGYAIQTILLLTVLYISGKTDKLYKKFPTKEIGHIFKTIILNIILSGMLIAIYDNVKLPMTGKMESLFRIILLGAAGGAFYLLCGYLLKLPELEVLIKKGRNNK